MGIGDRYMKYWKNGIRFYVPFVSETGRPPRFLRKSFRTATGARDYGVKVMYRYHLLLAASAPLENNRHVTENVSQPA
jgi:hypothetical protein